MRKILLSVFMFFTALRAGYAADLKFDTKILKGGEANFNYTLKYPQFEKLSAVNKRFAGFVSGELASFKKEFGGIKNPNGQKNELVVTFSTYSVTSATISVRMNTYMYTGGAHGVASIKTFNIKPGDNSDITLAAVFGDEQKAVGALSEISRRELMAQLKAAGVQNLDLKWFEQGTSSSTANYRLFNFGGGNIYIQFPQYQVAPYCYGEMEVKISVADIFSAIKTVPAK